MRTTILVLTCLLALTTTCLVAPAANAEISKCNTGVLASGTDGAGCEGIVWVHGSEVCTLGDAQPGSC